MKVLSVKNPFSWLIVHGIKDIENRTWKTNYRGKILIHSSGQDLKQIPDEYYTQDIVDDYFNYFENGEKIELVSDRTKKVFIFDDIIESYLEKRQIYLKSGLIIGSVDLIDIVQDHDSLWAETNCYNWILSNPVIFKNPIIQKGKLGLTDYNGIIKDF